MQIPSRYNIPLKVIKPICCHIFFILLFFAHSDHVVSQEVRITEFMASNEGIIRDNLGRSSDWIEIYNASDKVFNLKDYYLTDDKKNKTKFKFPEFLLSPFTFYVVWASGNTYDLVPLPPDLDIHFESAGLVDGNYSRILIQGKNRSLNKRGMNVAILSWHGELIKSLNFDTYKSSKESDSLANCLNQLPVGQIVVFSVKDDASYSLTKMARETIASMGSEKIFDLDMRDSWGMIAIKGVGVARECFRKNGTGKASSEISNMHADFKLNKDGEYIGIYDAKLNAVDSVTFSAQIPDKSYGRITAGSERWGFLSSPSPGLANTNSELRYGKVNSPVFTPGQGVYSEPVNLEIGSTDSDSRIYYSVNGSIPDDQDNLYQKPLLIKQSSVIRAFCTKPNFFKSDIITQSYIIQPRKSLNIVSLVTPPGNLWDPVSGIYVTGSDSLRPNYQNRGKEWQRPALFSFFNDNGINAIHSDCAIRIHGGISRQYPKKSFRVYFSSPVQYSSKVLNFEDSHCQDVLVLSSGGNDSVFDREGTRQNWSLIRDHLMNQLYGLLGYPHIHKSPAILYLNGQYWGIYLISERINEQFLKNYVDFTEGDLIKDNAVAEKGNLDHWLNTIEFFKNSDLSIEVNYKKALNLVNIENFTDYYILNLFADNWDWPSHNIYCYYDRQNDGKWNWLMWDADCAFYNNPDVNSLHDVLSIEKDNEIFFNLIQYEKYRTFFSNRTCYLLNNRLTSSRINSIADSLYSNIEMEIENETQRWGGSKIHWMETINKIKKFADKRPAHFRKLMDVELNVGKNVFLNILNEHVTEGNVKINGNPIKDFPFHGTYFANIPIQLTVEPNNDFIFKSWGNGQENTEITVNLNELDTLNFFLQFEKIEKFKKDIGTFRVLANYPNPFSSKTNIKLFSIADTDIKFEIYNVKGQLVSSMNEKIQSGYNILTWDAKNDFAFSMPSGLYFYVISDTEHKVVKKMTLLR